MVEMQQYEKRLSQALDCPKPLRRRLLERTRQMAEDFTAGKPDAAWDEVEEFLGDPQELAQTMLEHENQEKLTQYRKRKLYFRRSVIGILIATLILVSCGLIYEHQKKIPVNVIVESTLTVYETED